MKLFVLFVCSYYAGLALCRAIDCARTRRERVLLVVLMAVTVIYLIGRAFTC